MKSIINALRDSSLDEMNVDGQDRFLLHGKMLARKRLLREVFTEFHHMFRRLDERFLTASGARIELGAGVAPIKNSYPDVVATDIVDAKFLDRALDAQNMDLPEQSVRVFYGQNCFHHFPNPSKFFFELERVLPPGGGAILLEPHYGPFASFLYKRLFSTEGFDKNFPTWETPATGPMNGANQALSYVVFVRDRRRFEKEHPSLKIVHEECCGNYLKYFLSGGLNFKQLCPDALNPLVNFMQWCLTPFQRLLALHHVVVIKRV